MIGWWRWLGVWCCLVAGAAPGAAVEISVCPAAPAPGEVFRVELRALAPQVAPQLRAGNRTFALWRGEPGQWQGLVAVDRDEAADTLRVEVVEAEPGGAKPLLGVVEVPLRSRDYPEQHLQVRDRMVHLSPEDQARANRENRKIRAILGQHAGPRRWAAPFALPAHGPFTSPFGVRRVYNGTPRGYHSGLDIAVPRGTAIAATSEGRVALVGDFFYTGNTVFLDHGLGLYSAYFHLDAVQVQVGEEVDAGAVLGAAGSTGRSTGPHLHWGIYLAGTKVDPLSLMELLGGGGAGGGESP